MTSDEAVGTPTVEPPGKIATVSSDAWRAVVRLRGEFDVADAAPLHAIFDDHLDAGRRVLRLDMRDVTFLDSTILGVVVSTHARCQEQHGSLILTGVRQSVQRVIDITGLDQILLIDTADAPDDASMPTIADDPG